MDFNVEKFKKELSEIDKRGKIFNLYFHGFEKLTFQIFPEWYEYVKNTDLSIQSYKPDIKFNYYILINQSFYKEFMKLDCGIKIFTLDEKGFNYPHIFPISQNIKLDKPHKNKKTYGMKYYKLKLRALSNMFIPFISLTRKHIYKETETDRDDFLKCVSNPLFLKIMIVPVKEKYTNIVELSPHDFEEKDIYRTINRGDLTFSFEDRGECNDILDDMIDIMMSGEKVYFNPKKHRYNCGGCKITNNNTGESYYLQVAIYIPQKNY